MNLEKELGCNNDDELAGLKEESIKMSDDNNEHHEQLLEEQEEEQSTEPHLVIKLPRPLESKLEKQEVLQKSNNLNHHYTQNSTKTLKHNRIKQRQSLHAPKLQQSSCKLIHVYSTSNTAAAGCNQ